MKSEQSDKALLKCGLPQGSVLGPIMFLLYMNHLRSLIDKYDMAHRSISNDNQRLDKFKPSCINKSTELIESCNQEMKKWLTS